MRNTNTQKLDALIQGNADWFQQIIEEPKLSKVLKPNDSLLVKFNDINSFFDIEGREPNPDADSMKESSLGTRLRGMRNREDDRLRLKPHDRNALLATPEEMTPKKESKLEPVKIDDLLDDPIFNNTDTINTSARANRPSLLSSNRAVFQRRPCEDFECFKLKFKTISNGLEKGSLVRTALIKGSKAQPGDTFLWRGMICFVEKEASLDEQEYEGRIRIIFSNGTESWMKPASVTRHFYALRGRGEKNAYVERVILASDAPKDETPDISEEEGDTTGYVYVARTLSTDPNIIPHKKSMVKIGSTKNSVKTRVAGAEKDPTFLLARVKVVRTFILKNLDPLKVEKHLHKLFAHRQLEINIHDRFGKHVSATEWFAVSPAEVSEAIEDVVKKTDTLKDLNSV